MVAPDYSILVMVKDGVPSRAPVPDSIYGLGYSDLADLTWVDPALGFMTTVWWPEEIVPQELPPDHKFTDEIFEVITERKVVKVTRVIEPMTQEEIEDRDNSIKADRKYRIEQKRQAQEPYMVAYNGKKFYLDQRNKYLITDMRGEALVNPLYTGKLKSFDGSWIVMSNSEIFSVASAVRAVYDSNYNRQFELDNAVDDWTFTEEMLDQGWQSLVTPD